ncbi:hypothetical protein NPIL_147691 [Nephila pilipes]|uniref:Uncharacterized protein n=1 Tax=Nephila pilipes TaxID=299642 RepID=A0A8X6TZF2_NEPPI|nr:hypothetical protein NPIL_147691 [Nephila pilipes]
MVDMFVLSFPLWTHLTFCRAQKSRSRWVLKRIPGQAAGRIWKRHAARGVFLLLPINDVLSRSKKLSKHVGHTPIRFPAYFGDKKWICFS